MSVFARVQMPALDGATEWLNSEPLGPAELRGHVVLVNFWTLTCINWLRQEPYVRAWSQAYRDDGLIVIGVHTPEFSFEHEVDGIRRAIEERAIGYPGAVYARRRTAQSSRFFDHPPVPPGWSTHCAAEPTASRKREAGGGVRILLDTPASADQTTPALAGGPVS
jgi:thiol-disulfide isomerase/thioredoxin